MDMNFNPNAQGVFLLGQLVLDYTSIDGSHTRDHVRMNAPYGNELSGDGPHGHTFNPDAEEFHPTSESKVPLNTTAYPEHYEVRVFNTPLATHLQFPQEVPYYGYPPRPGFHHQHHHFAPGTTTILHPSPHPPPPPLATNMQENSDGVPSANIVSVSSPPIQFSSTMDWIPPCGQSYMCPHIPPPVHVASTVHTCPGMLSSSFNNNDCITLHNSLSSSSLPFTSCVPVYTGDNSYMVRRNDQNQTGTLGEGEGFAHSTRNKDCNQNLLVLSSVGEPISLDPSRTTSPIGFSDDDGSSISTSPVSVTTTKSNHSHQYLMTDDTTPSRKTELDTDNHTTSAKSHELQQVEDNIDEYEFNGGGNQLELNPKAVPFFPTTSSAVTPTSITSHDSPLSDSNNNEDDTKEEDGEENLSN